MICLYYRQRSYQLLCSRNLSIYLHRLPFHLTFTPPWPLYLGLSVGISATVSKESFNIPSGPGSWSFLFSPKISPNSMYHRKMWTAVHLLNKDDNIQKIRRSDKRPFRMTEIDKQLLRYFTLLSLKSDY